MAPKRVTGRGLAVIAKVASIFGAVALTNVSIANNSPSIEQQDGKPSGETVLETIYLDLGASDREYAPAPCDGCLDERAVLDTATVYLDTALIDYLDVRAERVHNFPWRGHGLVEFRHPQDKPLKSRLDRRTDIEYLGEAGFKPGSKGTPDAADETWRVWYQIGWVALERIERLVESGELPLEALAWPPRPVEHFILIHARTGLVGHTPMASASHQEPALVERDQRARRAASQAADRWFAMQE